jgi:hypothetical protein
MGAADRGAVVTRWRTLIAAGVATLVVLGLGVVTMSVGRSATSAEPARVDALATSSDRCVVCHRKTTPGIVQQYGLSTMAAAGVGCPDCHVVAADFPDAVAHEDTFVLSRPTTAMCAKCHPNEAAQFVQSRHALPAYVAFAGSKALSPALLAQYQSVPEGSFVPDSSRNVIGMMEGEALTHFACESCHDIGRPAADGSIGQCVKCHGRHEFSLAQVRKPETCNNCHIGPDHPQWEIYFESKHGIAYSTGGEHWSWNAKPGTLTVKDFPAPTCATCHMSGFGNQGSTHDVGDRLSWYLFAPISDRRPAWQDNATRMQSVCRECHNGKFIADFYARANAATESVNAMIRDSDQILADARATGAVSKAPFDDPIEFTHFETWHHYGRTAKFGVWMQGADYTQWHGAYEVVKGLAELRHMAADLKAGARPGGH